MQTADSLKIIDCRKLISEIAKRPLLFNLDLPEYGDKHLKNRHWLEVAQTITNDWHELSKEKKNERVKKAQRKWKSLRDSFQRDCSRRVAKFGNENCGSRRYVYYDDLKFLLSVKRGRTKFKKSSSSQNDDSERMIDSIDSDSEASEVDSCDPLVETCNPVSAALVPNSDQRFGLNSSEMVQLNVPNLREDEDMLFFYSLMPDYKKFSNEQKYRFKMGVLDLMRQEVTMNLRSTNDVIISSQFTIKPPQD